MGLMLRKRLFNWAAEVTVQDHQPQQVLQARFAGKCLRRRRLKCGIDHIMFGQASAGRRMSYVSEKRLKP